MKLQKAFHPIETQSIVKRKAFRLRFKNTVKGFAVRAHDKLENPRVVSGSEKNRSNRLKLNRG
jgi:hypothetical protein